MDCKVCGFSRVFHVVSRRSRSRKSGIGSMQEAWSTLFGNVIHHKTCIDWHSRRDDHDSQKNDI